MLIPEFKCETVQELRDHIESFTASLGLHWFGFVGLAKNVDMGGGKLLHIMSSAPEIWERSIAEAVNDGSPHNSIRHSSLQLPPVGWSTSGHIAGHTILDDFALEQVRRIRHMGMNAGTLTPVFSPEFEWGFVAFYSKKEMEYEELFQTLLTTSLYASNFCFWYMQIAIRRRVEKRSLLSERESECLRQAARGLTSEEIAGSLGIGRRTVESYIASACNKLKARGRREAITIASDMQLIGGRNAIKEQFENQRDEFSSTQIPQKIDFL